MAFNPTSLAISFLIAGASLGFAQDPLTAFPQNYTLALDNSCVSVVRVHYGPHERIGVHDHSKFPTVYVYLSDSGPVRFEHEEKLPFALTRPPTTKGAFRVSPGRIERHSVQNLSSMNSDFLRVELKQVPLKSLAHAFRGKAPSPPLRTSLSAEFSSPEFDIERAICASETPCILHPSPFPSLLIAFSRVKVAETQDAPNQPMRDGDLKWLEASQPLLIEAASSAPAHLLRITFKHP